MECAGPQPVPMLQRMATSRTNGCLERDNQSPCRTASSNRRILKSRKISLARFRRARSRSGKNLQELNAAVEELPPPFPFVLLFGGRFRLPLHVGRNIGASRCERFDVVHDIARAGSRFLACRGTGMGPHESSPGRLAALDAAVPVALYSRDGLCFSHMSCPAGARVGSGGSAAGKAKRRGEREGQQ